MTYYVPDHLRAPRIAFNTANLVGRVTGYQFKLSQWMDQHHATIALTDESSWRAICREIAAAGYGAVEIWQAHADPSVMTAPRTRDFKKILADHGLIPVGYAGAITDETLLLCDELDIPAINGQFPKDATIDDLNRMTRRSGVRFNLENHPQKTAAEVLARIKGGNDMIGVAVDTGWFATQGADVAREVEALGSKVRHVHIKDVKAHGGHETCPLGTGVAGLDKVFAALKRIGYSGCYSWEDEPEDRNPMLIAEESRKWIQARIPAAKP